MKKAKEINLEELLKVDLELDEKGKMYTKMSLEQINNIADVMCELWESNKHLQEDNDEWYQLLKIQDNRKYRKRFLKEYRKEREGAFYPDYDEIYKRYYKLKEDYEKIYNENCKLIENHSINDVSLLDENVKLQEEIKKIREMNKAKHKYASNMEDKYITEKTKNQKAIEYIEHENLVLKDENERLRKENNDLKLIYRNTYKRLFENGNDELARYFQAQIDDCPTFYIAPPIDYYKETQRLENAFKELKDYIKNLPNDEYIGYWKKEILEDIAELEEKGKEIEVS